MSSLWRALKRPSRKPYDFQRLIDSVIFEEIPQRPNCTHIICDIDKTYLETEFETVLKMARIAVEPAVKKRTVRGASDVLLALRWPELGGTSTEKEVPRPLHFVSSSPPQLRMRLEEKLSLDGLDWSSDTFKNQVYNVLKGRMDLLRQHVAYKSASILQLLQISGKTPRFILIGDNAESDAYIYIGVTLYLLKKLSPQGYGEYLRIAGIDQQTAIDFTKKFEQVPDGAILGILIRNAPGYTFVDHPVLGKPLRLFDNFFQAALMLMNMKLIPVTMLWSLVRNFHNQHGFSRTELLATLSLVESQSEFQKEAAEIKDKLMAIKPAPKPVSPSKLNLNLTPPDFSCFDDISEAQILAYAREWVAKMQNKPTK